MTPLRACLSLLFAAGAIAACGDGGAPSNGTSSTSTAGAGGTGSSTATTGNGGTGGAGGAGTSTGGASAGSSSTSSGGSTSSSGMGGESTSSSSSSGSTSSSSSGSSTSTTSSGSGGGCTAPAPAASDVFNGSSLDPSWNVLNPGLVSLSVGGGKLSLTPNQYLLWYNQSQGTLVEKLVTGDFKVTSTVRARRASNPSMPPNQHIHLAGLMARNPGSASENYVFIVVGNDETDLSVETKTTVNGASSYQGPSWPSGDAELRICRLGASMHLYKRAIGAAAWTLAMTYARPDLPATLQVGANVYAAANQPDLVASFDEVRFEGVCDLAGCTEDGP